jgi:acetyl-CoA carboxylase biotin carboxyl carrier protein
MGGGVMAGGATNAYPRNIVSNNTDLTGGELVNGELGNGELSNTGARDRVEVLGALHDHARRLAEELPGQPARVRLRSGDESIDIEWHDGTPERPAQSHGAPPPERATQVDAASGVDPSVPVVTSPMVGTFYRAPKPGAKPFVDVGDLVEPGRTVGIVEAMKLMNPIVAETAGKVDQILVADGEPVDFGRPLMTLVPAG